MREETKSLLVAIAAATLFITTTVAAMEYFEVEDDSLSLAEALEDMIESPED